MPVGEPASARRTRASSPIMMNFATERLFLAGQLRRDRRARVPRVGRATRASARAFGKTLMGFQVDPPQARRHGDAHRRGARAHERGRSCGIVRGEQVAGLAAMAKNTATDMCSFVVRPGGADPRRLRLHARVRRRAAVPRRAPLPDRRRHARDHERDHLQDRGLLATMIGVVSSRSLRSSSRRSSPLAQKTPEPERPSRRARPRSPRIRTAERRAGGSAARGAARPDRRRLRRARRLAEGREPEPDAQGDLQDPARRGRHRGRRAERLAGGRDASIRTSSVGPDSSNRQGRHDARDEKKVGELEGHDRRDPRHLQRLRACPAPRLGRRSRAGRCSAPSSRPRDPHVLQAHGPAKRRSRPPNPTFTKLVDSLRGQVIPAERGLDHATLRSLIACPLAGPLAGGVSCVAVAAPFARFSTCSQASPPARPSPPAARQAPTTGPPADGQSGGAGGAGNAGGAGGAAGAQRERRPRAGEGGLFIPDGGERRRRARRDHQPVRHAVRHRPSSATTRTSASTTTATARSTKVARARRGQAHFCFKGDPSYRGTPGCFDGTEKCSENGIWGAVHRRRARDRRGCFANDQMACHPITSAPFAGVNLKDGTGIFSANAVPGQRGLDGDVPRRREPLPRRHGLEPARRLPSRSSPASTP